MGGILITSTAAEAQEPPPAYPAPPIHAPGPTPGYSPVVTPRRTLQTKRITRPHAVFVELGGKGLAYGVGYDHMILKWLGVGGSLSCFKAGEVSMMFINPYVGFHPAGGVRNSLVMHLGGTISYFSNSHDTFIPVWGEHEGADISGNFGIGYEYRNYFLFRVMVYGMFSEEGVFPWIGFTFGGAF